jgi:large subunit ribosomal protein L21
VYAIIRDRSRQSTVRAGDVITCDLDSDHAPGDKITFDDVLLVGDEGTCRVGKPTVEGASVSAEVLEHFKGKKLIAFRFKRRKNVRVKKGHRQKHTRVRIEAINA